MIVLKILAAIVVLALIFAVICTIAAFTLFALGVTPDMEPDDTEKDQTHNTKDHA